MRALVAAAFVLAGCAKAGTPDAVDAPGSDGPAADAPPIDADPCPDPQAWYPDADLDGFGDDAGRIFDCEQPAGSVGTGGDCDDTQALVHPGAAEVCDGLDNDCSAATAEMCTSGCVVRVRPDDGRRYLFCAVGASWTAARQRCAAELFRLARVDNQAEQTYLRSTATAAVGNVDVWFGASDVAAEGAWVWDDGMQFWSGGSGGVPVNGAYEFWGSGEPNDDGTEDCGEIRTTDWNDVGCGDVQPFICERY